MHAKDSSLTRRKAMGRILRHVASSAPVRQPVRALMSVVWACDRVWSHLRFQAIFPGRHDCIGHYTLQVKYPERITMGSHVTIGPRVTLGAMGGIVMGDYVRISSDVLIETGGLDLTSGIPYRHKAAPIVIGEGTWIGMRAVILAGVTIGEYAVIGAGTIVSKDVPARAIAVGGGGMRILGTEVPIPALESEDVQP